MIIVFLIFALIVIGFAIVVQQQNLNSLTKSKLSLEIFEKLNSDKNFRKIEDILTNSVEVDIAPILEEERIAFEEYLSYFDALAFMKIPNRFSQDEAEYLFKRPSKLLKKHLFVRDYIVNHNYKYLERIFKINNL